MAGDRRGEVVLFIEDSLPSWLTLTSRKICCKSLSHAVTLEFIATNTYTHPAGSVVGSALPLDSARAATQHKVSRTKHTSLDVAAKALMIEQIKVSSIHLAKVGNLDIDPYSKFK